MHEFNESDVENDDLHSMQSSNNGGGEKIQTAIIPLECKTLNFTRL